MGRLNQSTETGGATYRLGRGQPYQRIRAATMTMTEMSMNFRKTFLINFVRVRRMLKLMGRFGC